MIERDGHRYEVIENFASGMVNLARLDIQHLPDEAFDRYESPFEAKLTLREKRDLPSGIAGVFRKLESNDFVEDVSAMFGAELVADRWRHYAGVFRYLPGDYLGVHVDAGIHPTSGLRKHVTAVLYLGGSGALELWNGYNCMAEDAQVVGVTDAIEPAFGTLVLFENNDRAWHAAARNDSDQERIVLTVSYLSGAVDAFANRRQRAFFVPRPTEEWSPETYRLRDLRADAERYREAYRA